MSPENTNCPRKKDTADFLEEQYILSILICGPIHYTSVHPVLEDFFFLAPEHRSIFLWLKQQKGAINQSLLLLHLITEHNNDYNYVVAILTKLQELFREKLSEKPEETLNVLATNLAKKRQFKDFSQQINKNLEKTDPGNIEHIQAFFNKVQHESKKINDTWDPVLPKLRRLKEISKTYDEKKKERESSVIRTPFVELNNCLKGGLRKKNVIVVGARPNIGKTTFAANLCLHFALHELQENEELSFWSLEDTAESIYEKFVISTMRGKPSEENEKIARAKVDDLPINITDAPDMEIEKIILEIKRSHKICPNRVIFIDYLNKLTTTEPHFDRLGCLRIIMSKIRELASSCNCTVVVLAQINRQSDAREEKTPRITELKESGTIEECADIVLLLHRDYPNLACRKKPSDVNKAREHNELLRKEKNRGQIILAKNKEGYTCNVEVIYWQEGGGFFPYSDRLADKLINLNCIVQ